MANLQHLKILRRSVKEWNQWRKENPAIKPKLSGADLTEVDLSSADLSSTYLSYADLIGAHLTEADLSYAHLSGADLIGADLREADLSGAHLTEADLIGAHLRNADLSGAHLRNADLSYADLREADLSGANLTEADLRNADLRNADLRNADLRNADLRNADLSSANLKNTQINEKTRINAKWRRVWEIVNQGGVSHDLSGANLSSTYLREANLREANLREAHLSGAHLREANLSGANLSNADLSGADLREANLSGADLREANLREANLREANLREADLSGAHLREANLSNADLSNADLSGAHLREANLSGAKLRGSSFKHIDLSNIDLRKIDLKGVNLSGNDLKERNFNSQNLSEANLTEVNLTRIQALGTNFQNAILTGACIEDWNINSETNLNGVICDYIYLKENKQERRPADSTKNFQPGEFTKLFTKITETVDLIFKDGIDWQIFLKTFQELRVESDTGELPVVQTIENKGDGAFVIRVKVPNDVDEGEYEQKFRQKYELQLEAKDEKIKLLDEQKDFYYQQVEIIRKDNTRLIGIIETMAEKENTKYDLRGSKFGGGFAAEGGTQTGGTFNDHSITYSPEQKQTLADAAAEIQKLLKQLEESNPTATVEQQEAFVNAALSPTLKARFVSALQAGWKEAMKEFLDNPYVNVGVAILEGWQDAE